MSPVQASTHCDFFMAVSISYRFLGQRSKIEKFPLQIYAIKMKMTPVVEDILTESTMHHPGHRKDALSACV